MTGILPLFARPIDEILAILPELDEHFQVALGWEDWRYPSGRHLATIPLRRQPGSRVRDLVHQLAVVATRYTAYSPLSDASEAICAHVGGRMGRAFLGRLAPGSEIQGKIEEGIYERAVERFILPIRGNEGVTISFGDTWSPRAAQTINAGLWYAVDAHEAHLITNAGSVPFVFLVTDIFPEQGEQPSGIDYDHLCPRAFG